MKFYYNDKLVRTSKNHEYTHAVINVNSGRVIGCRSSKDAAEALKKSYINERMEEINNEELAIKALKAGKSYYIAKCGRRSYPFKFDKGDTVEVYEKLIEDNKRAIEYYTENYKIVELEQR